MDSLPFEIVNKDGFSAIKNKNSGIAILIYTLDENELLDRIGIITEKNPHFPEGSYKGLVMGTIESDDSSLLSRAKKEALEEIGYDISDNNRWDFLGEIYTSKIFTDSIYCYSADVTGLDNKKASTKQDKNSKFSLVPLNRAQKIPDSILQSCFFKLFTKLYKNQIAS